MTHRTVLVAALAAAAATAACSASPDYSGFTFSCDDTAGCPSDFMCVEKLCVAETDTLMFVDGAQPGGLDGGRLADVELVNGQLKLVREKKTGTFVSRVLDAGRRVRWTSISWAPNTQYGLPLPKNRAPADLNMTGNVALFSFDGLGPLSVFIEDESDNDDAKDHDALSTITGVSFVPGQIGGALRLEGGSLTLGITNQQDFSFGQESFSWATWARVANDRKCTDIATFAALDSSVSDNDAGQTLIWLGCRASHAAAHISIGNDEENGPGNYSGDTIIDDGQWHHIAVVKDGHRPATITLYVDGNRDHSQTFTSDFGTGSFSTGVVPVTIGRAADIDPTPYFTFAGSLDELAIWRRALSSTEISQIYQRGARRMSFQVRTCSDQTCSNGALSPRYEEDGSSTTPGSRTLALESRYLQYNIEITGTGSESPLLETVTLAADALPQ